MMLREVSLRIRQFPGYFAGLGLVLVLTVVGGWWCWREAGLWRVAEARCARLEVERSLPQMQPELIEAARASLAVVQSKVAAARERWPGPVARERLAPIEVFARMVEYRERLRGLARERNVALPADLDLGFGRYRNDVPELEAVDTVLAEHAFVRRVLERLLVAGPVSLDGVELDRSAAEGAAAGRWALPIVRSLRVGGLVRSRALRVRFGGGTACLRRFLNELAAEPGLLVREVFVAPSSKKGRDAGAGAPQREGVSEFSVSIEAVELEHGATSPVSAGSAEACDPWPIASGSFEVFSRMADGGGRAELPLEAGRSGVKLLEIREEFPRWRLIGCAGEGTRRIAVVVDRTTGRTMRLSVGGRDPATGVELAAMDCIRAADGSRRWRARLTAPELRVPIELGLGESAEPRRVGVVVVEGIDGPQLWAEGDGVRIRGQPYRVSAVVVAPPGLSLQREGEEAPPLVLSPAP